MKGRKTGGRRRRKYCNYGHRITEHGNAGIRGCATCANARRRRWCRANPARVKNHKLRYRYGITLIDYQKMFAQQNGLCAICSREKSLHVDHNHETGAVRHLLCADCNKGIGLLRSSHVLRQAATYLDQLVRQ